MSKKKRGGDSATIREGQQYLERVGGGMHWTSTDVFNACDQA